VAEPSAISPAATREQLYTAIPYQGQKSLKSDLCTGARGSFDWAVEIKMLQLMGDEGKPTDNMLAIEAFELLARAKVELGPRASAAYADLVRPVHRAGRVFGWEGRQLAAQSAADRRVRLVLA
jgi:hypothetical protein